MHFKKNDFYFERINKRSKLISVVFWVDPCCLSLICRLFAGRGVGIPVNPSRTPSCFKVSVPVELVNLRLVFCPSGAPSLSVSDRHKYPVSQITNQDETKAAAEHADHSGCVRHFSTRITWTARTKQSDVSYVTCRAVISIRSQAHPDVQGGMLNRCLGGHHGSPAASKNKKKLAPFSTIPVINTNWNKLVAARWRGG